MRINKSDVERIIISLPPSCVGHGDITTDNYNNEIPIIEVVDWTTIVQEYKSTLSCSNNNNNNNNTVVNLFRSYQPHVHDQLRQYISYLRRQQQQQSNELQAAGTVNTKSIILNTRKAIRFVSFCIVTSSSLSSTVRAYPVRERLGL